VAQAKALSRVADRRSHFIRRSSDLQKQLMLLGLKTKFLRRRLTEVKKKAELVAKFRECLKPARACRHSFRASHCAIISHHDILRILDETGGGLEGTF
jgi:hypothetical protein